MKDGIHPKYHPVVFVDSGANAEFVTRSTMRSKETREIDGVEHFVIRLDVSSASHPLEAHFSVKGPSGIVAPLVLASTTFT